MKILLTGGTGYLGGRLAQYLSTKYDVTLALRKEMAVPAQWDQKKIRLIDYTNSAILQETCHNMDCIVHLAGMNAKDSEQDPQKAIQVNGVNTEKLLQAAIKNKVSRFIYFSTAHVYGSPLIGHIDEKTTPTNSHSYATSHLEGENAVVAANDKKDISGIVIRLSNAFGAPATKDANCWMLLANDLCRQAVLKKHLTLHSSGEQLRDFITISDVGLALEHLIKIESSKVGSSLFNVGSGKSISVYAMAEMIVERYEKVTGEKIEISRRNDLITGTKEVLTYDNSKLINSGFKIQNNFNDEIDKLIIFCMNNFLESK